MKKRMLQWLAVVFAWCCVCGTAAKAQNKPGRSGGVIGYSYPAGACRNTEVEVEVGGAGLTGTKGALISGSGVSAVVVKHYKPLNKPLENKIRDMVKAEREKSGVAAKGRTDAKILETFVGTDGITAEDIAIYQEMMSQRRDPKRQMNAQLIERITLRVKVTADAAPGRRDLRLLGPGGLTNPVSFVVGTVPEVMEAEPNDGFETAVPLRGGLPVLVNGRVLPGDVDGFSFDARKGTKLTVAVAARELTPYLADAVPGWFQAVAVLHDASGREVGGSLGFAHRPDPLLCVVIPADGKYVLRIRDSISRGREDFVYRILIGEIPCLTEQFPLGGQVGRKVPVRVSGWSLPGFETVVDVGTVPGPRMMPLKPPILGFMGFEAGMYPEFSESAEDEGSRSPWELVFPCTINGLIGKPGDHDTYAFRLKAGTPVVAEIRARRLGSALDSMLRVTGPDGKQVALNDDCDDPGSGLLTHHADSRVEFKAAAAGIYQIEVGDTQGGGGRSHAYRLTVSPPVPGFSLRVVPSSWNVIPGGEVEGTAHIVRRDGFSGEVDLSLAGAPEGFVLTDAKVPAGKDSVKFRLKIPWRTEVGVMPLEIRGTARTDGKELVEKAVPAEDRMQAFFYRHLVPADELLLCVRERGKPANPAKAGKQQPGKGKTAVAPPVQANKAPVPSGK